MPNILKRQRNLPHAPHRIGKAIARRLGQEGASVVVSSRKGENVKETVEEFRREKIDVYGIPCHVSNAQDRKHLVEEVGRASYNT